MRLASFRAPDGDSFGIVDGEGIVDIGRRHGIPSLRAALAGGTLPAPGGAPADYRLSDVVLLPPVPDAGKIICVGLNYRSHAAEAGRALPAQPSLFLRANSTIVGHGSALVRPRVSDNFDFEGELALVIGTAARHVPAERALGCIAGYTCFNDGSLRDFQRHSVTAGKNFQSSGACGPWMVTAADLPDPANLSLTTRLNGQQVQHATTASMIYPVPVIIAYVSQFITLEPGDIIATGTPEGVGLARTPPLWMKPGDRVEVEIDGIGILANAIEAED
jgi:2-keto-4-pentenoate hydratase/2-oxohepta-3-ene-1,7-dioic acid hydratase in catechol pathway